MWVDHRNRSWAKRVRNAVGALGLIVLSAGIAEAAFPDLITNGNFETVPAGTTQSYKITTGTPLPGWTQSSQSGIDCLVYGGVNNMCGTGYTGPVNPVTFAVFPGVSPAGGNFLANDSAPTYQVSMTQNISGLYVGEQYILTFYQAGAQQIGYVGATTDQWRVTFGPCAPPNTNCQNTSMLMNVAQQSDYPWNKVTMIFRPSLTTQTLSFLALGTPDANPPFALLDGVSLFRVPEPASLGLMAFGMAGIAALRRRRARRLT